MVGVVNKQIIYCNSDEEMREIVDRLNSKASDERIKQIKNNFEKSRNSEIKIERENKLVNGEIKMRFEGLYKIEKAEDLEGNLKELPLNNMKAHYEVDWDGNNEPAYLVNRNRDIDHYGMRTSHADSVVEKDGKLKINTMNSIYYMRKI